VALSVGGCGANVDELDLLPMPLRHSPVGGDVVQALAIITVVLAKGLHVSGSAHRLDRHSLVCPPAHTVAAELRFEPL
jgi:hypothetical protein